MSIQSASRDGPARLAEPRRFTRDEYHRMGEAGILTRDDRVELLNGVVITRDRDCELRRFTRDEYHRMAEAGILTIDDRVELLDGVIIKMSPIGPRHQTVNDLLTEFFCTRLSGHAIVRVQGPLGLQDLSEPQPDLSILRPRPDRYRDAHPSAGDILLLIEIAVTSVALDRGRKLAAYARAGISEYWVIDLSRDILITHRRPTGDEYGEVTQLDRSHSIAPQAFPECTLPLADVFA